MSPLPSRTVLFEMLRSFTVLARTLNLSQAVRILGSTRQTVRRHIDALEELRGEKLFELKDRQYALTDTGARSLKEAEAILARSEAWLAGDTKSIDGLELVKCEDGQGHQYWSQQHRVSRLWVDDSPLLQCGFQCWANGSTSIEAPELAVIRPYLVVYRRQGDSWLCVEVGDKSSYMSWFGWTWAKSHIGCSVNEMPAGMTYARYIAQAYLEVYEGNSVRLDHIHTSMPREKGGPWVPVSFQRLLLGCTFPDGAFALAVLVDRSYNISIAGLSAERIRSMPVELLMEYDPKSQEASE